MSFSDLGLSEELLRAVGDAGYETPTPIQKQAIPYVLMGRDILGCAQTGTGKTASFTLPMLDILSAGQAKARMPRSLILEPTRELAAQVAENFEVYGKYQKLNHALLIGGTSMPEQIKSLNRSVDVLIATPGRLMDVFERGYLLMNDVKILVIDEADRMLDMGFIPDVEKIVSLLPKIRTTLFFSATMPKEIRRLADKFLMNPKEITVAAPEISDETITQGLIELRHEGRRQPGGDQKQKREALRKLITAQTPKNALIFCNRKRDVDTVCRSLQRHGFEANRLHGDMSQPERMATLAKFKNDEVRYLVCSDVAARGLDIPSMSHVFNFDIPTHAEDYIHRIGRTGRAGNKGHAFTIVLPEDQKYLDGVERLIGRAIPRVDGSGNSATDKVVEDAPKPQTAPVAEAQAKTPLSEAAPASEQQEPARKPRRRRRSGGEAQPQRQPQAESQPQPQKHEERPARQSRAKNRPQPQKQEERPARQNQNQGSDGPVKGLGDHVPAFLK